MIIIQPKAQTTSFSALSAFNLSSSRAHRSSGGDAVAHQAVDHEGVINSMPLLHRRKGGCSERIAFVV